MACHECRRARESPAYPWFCPLCLWCGARLIQRLGGLDMPREEIANRRKRVLADWVSHGHAESELRRLAKQPGCYEPDGLDKPTESAPRKLGKRR
jgi:hypothetical protein